MVFSVFIAHVPVARSSASDPYFSLWRHREGPFGTVALLVLMNSASKAVMIFVSRAFYFYFIMIIDFKVYRVDFYYR